MKKRIKLTLIFVILILLIIISIIRINIDLSNKSTEKYGNWITGDEFLYDKAIEYLKKEKLKTAKDINKEDYQIFYDYEGFGIKEKDNRKYAYMYILEESYYIKHNKIRSSEGSCIPYKFIFENNEVIDYKKPEDGSKYAKSIKEIFPDDIENKVIKYEFKDANLKKSVEKYYSYLESTLIVDTDYDEDIIVIYGVCSGNTTDSGSNTIKGKCVDGYGDIYEYKIPCDEKQEILLVIESIDKNTIAKYQGNKITSISSEDLNIIKSNLDNLKEEYSNTKTRNKNNQISFVKVFHKKNNEDTILVLDYENNSLIDLLVETSDVRKENISEAGKEILNTLAKYNISI